MTLQDLQPYLTAISAALSVATLGLIVSLVKGVRDNAQDHLAAKEERLKGVVEDNTRLKEWSEREKAQLIAKLEEAGSQVDSLLRKEGIDPSALVAGKRLSDSAASLRATVQALTTEMQETISKLADLGGQPAEGRTASAQRTIAMVELASGRYGDAANQYDAYAATGSASWDDHLSRGVSHANARQGRSSDLAALLAYNDAIALAPDELDDNWRAKLFTYRGAMLKRLGRLIEADNDLLISSRLATEEHERLDAHYNLACVYAMQGRSEDMYAQLAKLQSSRSSMANVASHLHDYFVRYRSEPQFLSMLKGYS